MKRELVDTTIRTEFGDVLEDPAFYDVSGPDQDLSYVPGFSDMRRARDNTLAEVARGNLPKHEAKLTPLPVNLCWVRCTNVNGSPDARKTIGANTSGYRLVTSNDIGNSWLTAAPPGSSLGADGGYHKGDVVLMVCDGVTAARNAARKAALSARMTQDTPDDAAGLLSQERAAKGADPYIKQEPALAGSRK